MGPLHGIKVVEFAALGPAPMGAMLLTDLGAEVVRIERKPSGTGRPGADLFDPKIDILNRSRRVVRLDLKKPQAIETALRLIAGADAVVEGFRPGVMERIGLRPDVCLARNPRLVYGRMTGWGQTGTLAHAAGHDINYLSPSGALHCIGEKGGNPRTRTISCRSRRTRSTAPVRSKKAVQDRIRNCPTSVIMTPHRGAQKYITSLERVFDEVNGMPADPSRNCSIE